MQVGHVTRSFSSFPFELLMFLSSKRASKLCHTPQGVVCSMTKNRFFPYLK